MSQVTIKQEDNSGLFKSMIQNVKVSTNLGRTSLYELGRHKPYFRTVDFPVEIKTDVEEYCSDTKYTETDYKYMASLFVEGDYVKLINLIFPYEQYEGQKALVTEAKPIQTWFGTNYAYTVIMNDTMEVLCDLSIHQLMAWEDKVEVGLPKCVCEITQLLTAGCECGAMKKERELKNV